MEQKASWEVFKDGMTRDEPVGLFGEMAWIVDLLVGVIASDLVIGLVSVLLVVWLIQRATGAVFEFYQGFMDGYHNGPSDQEDT